jgi:hypothetical protein
VVDKNGDWSMFVAQAEGGDKVIYRIRMERPEDVVPSDYENCVVIEWTFQDALPDKVLSEVHKIFEGHMDPLGHDNPNSLLMHVYTRPGMKEWCYYARDYPAFMTELNAALAGKPRFPIDILHDKDPAWKYWSDIRDMVKALPGS